ncbi:MAG TPA: aldehyde dehydrogenase [Flavobacteriaceae bacterium]|nr:aldehyde dehydrogenase [Flavobacteriaceae bacterium]
MEIEQIIAQQRQFFKSQKTKDVLFRKMALKKLLGAVQNNEEAIQNALYLDFKKPVFESYISEIGIVIAELKLAIKKLDQWSKPKTVIPSILNFPSWEKIYKEPYGTVLIIAPWNYPFQLAIAPLIGAVAAGNTAIIKPSELTPHTSKLVADLIGKCFDKSHVTVIQGDAGTARSLLNSSWDYIFFTGSIPIGKIIAKAAAEHLTPTTLELGGKSPCIIDETADIHLSAKRIVWGKFLNAGQTCIAPDYILIHNNVKDTFVAALKKEIENAYGENPQNTDDYPRIINLRNYHRLIKMLENETILIGGENNENDLYIAPTVLHCNTLNCEAMKEEIFGPILPILTYTSEEEIEAIISSYEKPLSLYVFTSNKSFAKKIIKKYSFGGGVINDTVVHFANHRLPFGGVGHSGQGAYHGKHSFDTFSHAKSVVNRFTWLDIPLRYAPYKGKLPLLKLFFKYLS